MESIPAVSAANTIFRKSNSSAPMISLLVSVGYQCCVAVGPRRRRRLVAVQSSLGVRSEASAPVAFTWDGSTYTIEFSE